jgi:hypothetical protein
VALFSISLYFILIEHFSVESNSNFTLLDKLTSRLDLNQPNRKRFGADSRSSKSTYEDFAYNIFFLETSDTRQFFSARQLCAIESAAFNNQNSVVHVLSLKAQLDPDSLQLFSKYLNINWLKLDQVFNATPLLDWWKSSQVLKSGYKVAHLSDASRLALLYKYGGFYSDLDTITVRNLLPLSKYAAGIGYLYEEGDSIGNGFLYFKAGHPFLESAMKEMKQNYKADLWGFNGPVLFMRQIKALCNLNDKNMYKVLLKSHDFYELRNKLDFLVEKKKLSIKLNESNGSARGLTNVNKKIDQLKKSISSENAINSSINNNSACDIVIYPKEYIYPVTYVKQNFRLLFANQAKIDVNTFINSYSIHFYGKFSENLRMEANDTSIYNYFASKNCPNVYSSLKYDRR